MKKTHRSLSLTLITPNYPMPSYPERGVFVENLVRQWLSLGNYVNVIAPISTSLKMKTLLNKKTNKKFAGHKIIRNYYFSLTNIVIGNFNTNIFSRKGFLRAAMKGIKKTPIPDVFYGKFLLSGARIAAIAGKKYNRPAFADLGESTLLESLHGRDKELACRIISSLTGIVCVSERLKEEVIKLGANPNTILLAPNDVDRSKFKILDKIKCRQKLKLPLNAKIVAFTGHFIERKGPLRVLKAIEMLKEENIFGIFMGRGKQRPKGKKVLKASPVDNCDLPLWLNAADVFVLPTQAEGHCNAINEAIACGLPIISSNIPDIKKQLVNHRSILVEPTNIFEISEAIRKTFVESIEKVFPAEKKEESVNYNRAKTIIDWLQCRVQTTTKSRKK